MNAIFKQKLCTNYHTKINIFFQMPMCFCMNISLSFRPVSSAGQSVVLITRRSRVRSPYRPLSNIFFLFFFAVNQNKRFALPTELPGLYTLLKAKCRLSIFVQTSIPTLSLQPVCIKTVSLIQLATKINSPRPGIEPGPST